MADFNFITHRLATGAALTNSADVAQLKAAGIDFVIDCRAEFDDAPLFIVGGMMYLWCPTADDGQPKSELWFKPGIEFGLHALSLPVHKVLTHCAAGVNRGPSMAYAILRAFGITHAASMIRFVRPQVGLAYKQDAEAAIVKLGYSP